MIIFTVIIPAPSAKFFDNQAASNVPAQKVPLPEPPKEPVAPAVAVEPPPQPVAKPARIVYSGSHSDWMTQAGINPADFGAVEYIVQKESGWNPLAVNRSSGATGLCQSLPASKMATAGSDYLTNPITQLRWCDGYAKGRYGGWWNAYNFWVSNHWW